MSRDADQAAGNVVWNWRGAHAASAGSKSGAAAALKQAAVMGVVGAGLYFWLQHRAMGIAVS